MSTIPPAHRIELGPAVRAVLEADSQQSQFLKHYLRYLEALLAPDPAGLDRVVTYNGRCPSQRSRTECGTGAGSPASEFRRAENGAVGDGSRHHRSACE